MIKSRTDLGRLIDKALILDIEIDEIKFPLDISLQAIMK